MNKVQCECNDTSCAFVEATKLMAQGVEWAQSMKEGVHDSKVFGAVNKQYAAIIFPGSLEEFVQVREFINKEILHRDNAPELSAVTIQREKAQG